MQKKSFGPLPQKLGHVIGRLGEHTALEMDRLLPALQHGPNLPQSGGLEGFLPFSRCDLTVTPKPVYRQVKDGTGGRWLAAADVMTKLRGKERRGLTSAYSGPYAHMYVRGACIKSSAIVPPYHGAHPSSTSEWFSHGHDWCYFNPSSLDSRTWRSPAE